MQIIVKLKMGVVEFFLLWISYTFIQQYLIQGKIMKWRSGGVLKDCFDEFGDDCRFRARGFGGEAPNR